jgi:hypothetical protein
MSAPRRWVDSPEVPKDVKDLFESGRPTRGMSRETRARMSLRLATPIAAGVVTSSVAAWKSVAIAAGIGLAATTAVVAVRSAAHSPHVIVGSPRLGEPVTHRAVAEVERRAPGGSVVPPTSPRLPQPAVQDLVSSTAAAPPRVRDAVAVPVTRERSPAVAASEVPIEATAPPVDRDTLAVELALLEQARASYASDPQGTLDRLDEHARRFPVGKLSIERDLLALDALKQLGRTDDEHARAERMLPAVRGTIYEQRVRTHLGADP